MPKGINLLPRSPAAVRRGIEEALVLLRHPDHAMELRRRELVLERTRLEVLKRTFLTRFEPLEHQKRLFEAGAKYKVRATMGGNRSGKTIGGCAETAYHATGCYPDWWNGKRFALPPKIWVCGKSIDKVVKGLQKMLFGTVDEPGTGFIPANRIVDWTRNPDVPKAVAEIQVRWGPHGTGVSTIVFKAYTQGRDSFESERVQVIHMDEEPPQDIYDECLMRLLGGEDDGGIMYLTFTPLYGMSSVVKSFLRRRENREELAARFPDLKDMESMMWHQHVSWEDNPTMSDLEKGRLILSMDPKTRVAREKGYPQLGAGLIFPYDRSFLVTQPFKIPDHWAQGFGLDHGLQHPCALAKTAWDPNTGQGFLTWCWRQSGAKIHEVADVIRQAGFPGILTIGGWDGEIKTQAADGISIHEQYRDRDIEIMTADKIRGDALVEMDMLMAGGMFKVFGEKHDARGPCEAFFDEIEFYHRAEDGKIVAENDDLICATIHAVRHRKHFCSVQEAERGGREFDYDPLEDSGTWMSD